MFSRSLSPESMSMLQHFTVLLRAQRSRLTSTLLLVGLFLMPTWAFSAGIGPDTFFPFSQTANASSKNKVEWRLLDERLAAIEKQLATNAADEKQLQAWMKEVGELNTSVNAYIENLEKQQEQLDSELATLGEAVENEAAVIAEQRKQITQRKNDLLGKLSGYKLLLLHGEELSKKLTAERQRVLTEHLLSRGPSSYELVKENVAIFWRWPNVGWRFITSESGLQELSWLTLVVTSVVLIITLALGISLRRKIRKWSELTPKKDYRYANMVVEALGHYAPHLLLALVTAIAVAISFPSHPRPFVYRFGLTLPLFFVSWAVLHFMFVGRGGVALFQLPERVARGFARTLKTMVLFVYSGYLIFTSEISQQLSETEQFIVRDVYVAGVVLVLLWAMRYLRIVLHEKGVRGIYGLFFLVLLTTLVGELLGYRNLSYWVLRALFGTGLVFGIFWLFARLLKEFFDGLQGGQIWWQRSLRQLLGYGVNEQMPWLVWVHGISGLALWLAFAYVVLRLWGMSAEALEVLYGYFFDGFLIGSLNVIPARIVVAILMFSVLLAVSGWIRKSMEYRWLVGSRMERGTREALVTISGYLGVAISILVALSVAGVQFTNLAIIAGALSVGIGFGLQNIVNNFVSGLILLFERPVKTGDWIMVGNTEGYVKRISIRSTLIQTFDRADVIVPNSELISGQVTNWMLYDPRGRVKVPIGVAYGSDTQQVKNILLRIAVEQPKVITDGSVTEPKVLFMGFGDSSLNFELRAFIQNIDERLQVVSDINFAIDAAFREHNIEIPFPQRDLHVRSWQSPPDSP